MMKAKLSIVRCGDYQKERVLAGVEKAVGLLGGAGKFIKPKSRVLVKPNLLMAKEPQFGITTHPEVVRAVIRLLKAIECQVILGDGPSVWGNHIENVAEVYERTGVKKVCQEEGVELVEFNKRRWRGKFPLSSWLDNCDHLVNIPKFKTHNLTLLTGAVKNLFGLVWGTYKTELHKDYYKTGGFAKVLVDIYQEAKPSLTVVDAVTAMEGEGPGTSGKLRDLNLILAGSDCVALDSVMAVIMGVRPLDVLSTKEAAARGMGQADINSIEILGEQLEGLQLKPFILPECSSIKARLPVAVVGMLKKLIRYYPCVLDDKCARCAACIRACPKKIISLRSGRIHFYYKDCIACFCCQEVCPQAAIEVRKSLLAKFIGL